MMTHFNNLHDVGSVGFFPEELAGGLHEGLLSFPVVVPDLGGETQDAHAVPRVHLGLPHGVQGNLIQLGVDVAGERSEAPLRVMAIIPAVTVVDVAAAVVVGSLLVLHVFVLLVLLEAGVPEVVGRVPVAPVGRVAPGAGVRRGRRGRR